MGDRSSDELALREIRHRLANTFQLIGSFVRLRVGRVQSDEAKRELQRLGDLVTSLGAIQETLAAPDSADFSVLLEDFAKNWQRVAGADREIRIVIETEPVDIPATAASPLALIAHELVSNALEHAFPADGSGTIKISLKSDQGMAELSVLDDGHGFDPEEASRVKPRSLGLSLVDRLAAQVGGSFELLTGEGTCAIVRIPLADGR